MIINKIIIRNFYSIKEAEIHFDKFTNQIVRIEGVNKDTFRSVGSGKSTIIEAVVWGIFGKTVRKSTIATLINNQEKKGVSVEVHINGDTVIRRAKKPDSLDVTIGDEVLTKDSANVTQAALEARLGINYNVFCASFVFGQHNSLDFIGATPEVRRTIIKSFLNLEDMFAKRDRAKAKKAVYSTNMRNIEAVMSEISSQLEEAQHNLDRIQAERGTVLSENGLTKEDLEGWDLDAIIAAEAEITLAKRKENDLVIRTDRLQDQIKKGVDECPTCGHEEEFDLTQMNAELAALMSAKSIAVRTLADCEEPPISSGAYWKIEEWNKLKAQKGVFEERNTTLGTKLDELNAEHAQLAVKYDVMTWWDVAFSENGIVRYVIRNILDYFNQQCNYYLNYLTQGKYTISFDEMLSETIFIGEEQTDYVSLSGGEGKIINLSVMLGLQSLVALTAQEESNMIFLDEIGVNFDLPSLENLHILLQELKKTRTIFIITHDSNLTSLLESTNVITATKQNGITTIA